jgi:hypothetical protein
MGIQSPHELVNCSVTFTVYDRKRYIKKKLMIGTVSAIDQPYLFIFCIGLPLHPTIQSHVDLVHTKLIQGRASSDRIRHFESDFDSISHFNMLFLPE